MDDKLKNINIEKLILKEMFKLNGLDRTNTFKIKSLNDGTFQLWVSNGNNFGTIRLYDNTARVLLSWLQRNIK